MEIIQNVAALFLFSLLVAPIVMMIILLIRTNKPKQNPNASIKLEQLEQNDYNIVDDVFKTPDNAGAVKLPSFGLVDAGVTTNFKLFGNNTSLRVNVNNVLDTTYIAESETNIHATAGSQTWNGVDVNNSVWFGFGRTWNASLKYRF